MPDSTTGPTFEDVRLHVVTGKGGTGKTTVAAALALSLASLGRTVLLVEVEGRQGISRVFDVPPLGDVETSMLRVSGGGEVWGLSVDAKAALLEYLDIFYRLGRAGSVLERIGAIDFATTIAPGVRDVLLIGKVYEAVRRRGERSRPTDGHDAPWTYDAVVLDAPPTGRVAHFLNVNDEVADLTKVGPIKNQADSITHLLRSEACVVHLTTLLEDMPVQETLDAVADIDAIGVAIGSIVVDRTRPDLASADTLAGLSGWTDPASPGRAGIADALRRAHLDCGDDVVGALLAQAHEHAARLDLEDRLLVTLEESGVPLVILPELDDGADPDGIRVLAQHLAEQAVWS